MFCLVEGDVFMQQTRKTSSVATRPGTRWVGIAASDVTGRQYRKSHTFSPALLSLLPRCAKFFRRRKSICAALLRWFGSTKGIPGAFAEKGKRWAKIRKKVR